ncbi:hypothetical protein SU69_07670 [Thermosipho melanesiensis]|uniref:Lipoprotein n=2 Tax=Thermosipho melanesiensis TaxID=46541 RepID=A6LN54_THEM4|nr:hypothetical protein [Thermosipho melanesiensis]ABR31355.1 hypothetical protein Tmel_1510 [Thermosipho melanesiensis BI429]APT74415.1 hypothetical protein BW47_08025 [Thermosipho melanesiensis]OOC36378.1 hypothetical protein SU68_07740 [Thermosipho melanesiensis]OOC37196.1 hypothetical protein SU69_07670 [Thermosipho melanesiensis]OOC37948.1 hypothetical protein SU70_07680 [Thermosipho melanesiensis]
MKKQFFLFLLLIFLLFGCNDENCIYVRDKKICFQENDEIISVNVPYIEILNQVDNLVYFEGVSQTGGIDIEYALVNARIDAVLKMRDFLGVEVITKNGNVEIDYGNLRQLSYDLIYLLNKSLEYVVFKRNRGNFYEVHTILFYIPSLKRFIPIYEDEFSRKIWQLATDEF